MTLSGKCGSCDSLSGECKLELLRPRLCVCARERARTRVRESARARVCVCVCVRERAEERERESARARVCVYVCVYDLVRTPEGMRARQGHDGFIIQPHAVENLREQYRVREHIL